MTRPFRALLFLSLFAASACGKDDPAEPHRKKGNVLFKKEEYAAAATEYEEALKLVKERTVKDLEVTAFAHSKAGEYDPAATLFLEAAQKKGDPKAKLETTINVAAMYLTQAHDLTKAEKYFSDAFALAPDSEAALGWLAELASQKGGARGTNAQVDVSQLDVALDRYDRLIAMSPTSSKHLVNKRIVLMKYIDFLGKQKVAAEKDAETNASDPQVKADFLDSAKKFQDHADQLKAALEETNKKFVDVSKAEKEAAKK